MIEIAANFFVDLWMRRTFVAAGYSLLLYDYFLTLAEEAKYIWNAPWTPVKVIFLISRYGNLVGQSVILLGELGILDYQSRELCDGYSVCCDVFIIASAEVSHALVLMRAWAIWRCQKTLVISLMVLYTTVIVAVLTVSTIDVIQSSRSHEYIHFHEIGLCIRWVGDGAWALFAASLLLDTILVVATIISLLTYSNAIQHHSSLLRLLFRDAWIFYFVSVLHSAFSIICWTMYSHSPKYLLAPSLTLPMVSITSQRVMLNLRSVNCHYLTTRDLSREVDRQMGALRSGNGALHQAQPPVTVHHFRQPSPSKSLGPFTQL